MGVEIAMPANQDGTTLKLDELWRNSWQNQQFSACERRDLYGYSLLCSYGTNFKESD
jgi:hypothetical protein